MSKSWLEDINKILACESNDLRELALACGEDPDTFYIGTRTEGEGICKISYSLDTTVDEVAPPMPEAIRNEVPPAARTVVKRGGGNLAIDLGTKNTRVYKKGAGIVFEAPSLVARRKYTGKELIFGHDAQSLIGHTSFIVTPLFENGDVQDDVALAEFFKSILKSVSAGAFVNPAVVASVQAAGSPMQRKYLNDALVDGGARRVGLLDKGMAAAMGANLPVHEPKGSMVVDLGAGRTEISVISLSGTVWCQSIVAAGDAIDKAIVAHLRSVENVHLRTDVAEKLKIQYVDFSDNAPNVAIQIEGVDLTSGKIKYVEVSSRTITELAWETFREIVYFIQAGLIASPPGVSEGIDVIPLTGGGALFSGLCNALHQYSGLSFEVADSPTECTIMGCAKVLEHPRWMKGVLGS